MMDDMIGMLVGLSVFIFLVFMYLLTKSVIDRIGARDQLHEGVRLPRFRDQPPVCALHHADGGGVAGGMPAADHRRLTLLFRAMLLPTTATSRFTCHGGHRGGHRHRVRHLPAVALLHIHRIKRVPLALALKVQE